MLQMLLEIAFRHVFRFFSVTSTGAAAGGGAWDGWLPCGEDEAVEVGVRERRVPYEAVHPHIGVEVRGGGEVREHRVGRGRPDERVGEEVLRVGPRAAGVRQRGRRDLAVRGRRGRRHRRRLARRELHRRRWQVMVPLLLLFHLLRDGHEIATVRTHVRHGVPSQHRHGEDGKEEGVQLTTLKRSVT